MGAKSAFLIGGAVGYVLGTRAGREHFERLQEQARKVWDDPRVRDVEQRATALLQEKYPELKDKVCDVVRSATQAVRERTGREGCCGEDGCCGDKGCDDERACDGEDCCCDEQDEQDDASNEVPSTTV